MSDCPELLSSNINVNTLGGQGLPGTLPSVIPATAVDYGPTTLAAVNAGIDDVDGFLGFIESSILPLFLQADGTADFCPTVDDCLGTSAVLEARLGTPVTGLPAIGNATGDGYTTFSGAVPGDMFYITPGGSYVSDNIRNFLTDSLPETGQACYPRVLKVNSDGGAWTTGYGIPDPPTSWAYPLAPASLALELQANPTSGCLEWVCPTNVTGNYSIPGDFPTLNDFLAWSTGKTGDVELAVSANQTGPHVFDGFNGSLDLRLNGNSIGSVALNRDSTGSVTLQNGTVSAIKLEEGARLRTNAITVTGSAFSTNLFDADTAGVIVESGSSLTGTTLTINASELGMHISGGSVELTTLTANGGSRGGIRMDGGNLFAETITASNNTGNGITQTSGSISAFDLVANNNTGSGVLAGGSIDIDATSTTNSNGANGITSNGGDIISSGIISSNNNGNAGIISENGGRASLNGTSTISNNGTFGVAASTGGTLSLGGSTTHTISGNPTGVGAFSASSILVGGTSIATASGSTTGLVVTSNSTIQRGTGAGINLPGNTTQTNIPLNTLSADGSIIII